MKTVAPETLYPNFYTVPGKPDLTASFVNGNPHAWEVDWLCRIAECLEVKDAFEFGTFNGLVALHLAGAVTGKVLTLDKAEEAPARVVMPERVESLLRDLSDTFDFSEYEKEFGLVFVMGSNEHTRKDLKVAQRLVQPGAGVIVWHFGSEAEIPDGIENEFELTRLGESRLVIVGAAKEEKPKVFYTERHANK